MHAAIPAIKHFLIKYRTGFIQIVKYKDQKDLTIYYHPTNQYSMNINMQTKEFEVKEVIDIANVWETCRSTDCHIDDYLEKQSFNLE
jgi:hypothetical protein